MLKYINVVMAFLLVYCIIAVLFTINYLNKQTKISEQNQISCEIKLNNIRAKYTKQQGLAEDCFKILGYINKENK